MQTLYSKQSGTEQELCLLKTFLDFYKTNVFYLPKNSPEEIIWSIDKAEEFMKVIIQDGDQVFNYIKELNDIVDIKDKFALLAEIVFGKK